MTRCDTCRFLDAGYCDVLDVVVAHGQEVGEVCKVANMFDKFYLTMQERIKSGIRKKDLTMI